MDLERSVPPHVFVGLESFMTDQGITPACSFPKEGQCATSRLLQSVCETPLHADIIVPLVGRTREVSQSVGSIDRSMSGLGR
jgi:hypothetical protein